MKKNTPVNSPALHSSCLNHAPTILECTLRDGSYANKFQFNRHDTAQLIQQLEHLGFSFIEIGHGMGFGASELGPKFKAAETDEAYLQAANDTARDALWGMFCIPGIAQLNHLTMAADYGMKFIRVGTNLEDYQDMQLFVEKAKAHGFFTCANLMKSYTVPPKKFAEYAEKIQRFGVDMLYIVDSAGGMLPNELKEYIHACQDTCPELALGFHGHNNLGLGVANSLCAIEEGVKIVDSSLQGFGRSTGNAPTEQLVASLQRANIPINIDPIAVAELGEAVVQPLIEMKGLSALDIISGMALFHSSYMPIIEKYSQQYDINAAKLIVAVCQHNQSEAPTELVERCAKQIDEEKNTQKERGWKSYYKHYIGGEQDV